jgi:dipeptidyl aminopeptidase/acylaminoacyl peptidase
MTLRPVLFVLMLSSVLPFQAQATRGFDVRDLVTVERLSDPQLTSDGRTLVFAVRQVDYAANKASTGLWIEDLSTGKKPTATRLTPDGMNVNSPALSSDGKTVYFLSAKSGSMQLWSQPLAGGAPQQLSNYAVDVNNYKLSPDGGSVALSLDVFADCADLACSKKRLDAVAANKASGVLYDKLFIRHWDTWSDGRRSQLFAATFGADGKVSGEPTLLSRGIDGDVPSKPFGDASEYAWSPDSKMLAFDARIAGRTEPWSTNFDLFLVPADASAAPRNLTSANLAWDAGPVFGADGKTLYYRAMKRPTFEADRFGLMAMDLATSTAHEIDPQWDRSADGITLSADGKAIYTTAEDIGKRSLFSVAIADGKVTRIAEGGDIGGFALQDDALVIARDKLTSPTQLFSGKADGSDLHQVTNNNQEKLKDVVMGTPEQFSFVGAKGDTVYGYVVKPWNYQKGKRYPVAFLIHGGPQGSFDDHFHYRWNPQTYAGQGFAVVMIDFHGSTGYGQAFTDAISGDWGGAPLEDLQKGWAAAQEKYAFLDGDRACALGASYGGFMAYWIAGNWNQPWKCIVAHDGVFDSRMMGYATEELWFDEWENKGTPYETPEHYERFNPVNHVKDWRKPMLVIHSQLDYRIPIEQGIAAFTALQRQGIESEFLTFPDENHWILKPQNSVLWHDTVNAWLKRWTAEKPGTSP